MQKYKIYRQVYAAGSASLIMVAVGFHQGWASPSLPKLLVADSDVPITSSQGSWIASFPMIGSIFGSILTFFVVDRIGRKLTLLFLAIPLFLSCILIAVANSHWWFYVARFVAGTAIGSAYTVTPIYLTEIAEDRIRGGLGTLIGVMNYLGFLIPFSIGPWVSIPTLAGIGAVIPILFTLTYAWAPESPYHHAMKNAQYKTEESLVWLRGSPDVAEEVTKVQKNVDFMRKNRGTFMELFTVKRNVKALILMFGLLAGNQLSGSIALVPYAATIMDAVADGISSSLVVVMIGIVQLIGSVSIVFLADKAGRRPLLMASTSLCTIFLLSLAVYFQLQANRTDVSGISWLPVVALIGYFMAFSGGIGTIPMFMAGELFSCEIKAFALTVTSMYFSAVGVTVTKLYQIITDAFGVQIAFYIFTACCVVSTIMIFFFVPETKNRSLKDILDDLQGNTTEPMLPAVAKPE